MARDKKPLLDKPQCTLGGSPSHRKLLAEYLVKFTYIKDGRKRSVSSLLLIQPNNQTTNQPTKQTTTMQSRLLLKQAIRTIKTTSAKSKTNIGNAHSSVRFPSVKVNTTMSHTMTNDIKLAAQPSSGGALRKKTKHIPTVSSDNDTVETASPYLRV